jgi:hypothetical protein
LIGLPIEIFMTPYELQMQLQLTAACSWAFLLKLWVWQAILSFHHNAKQAPPQLFSS